MTIKKLLFIIILILSLLGCTAKPDKFPQKDKKDNNEDKKITEEYNGKNGEPLDLIGLQIKNMTLEEKIGQLVLVGMEGYKVNDKISDLIKTYHVGGIILYGKNVKDGNQLLALTNSLKDTNTFNKIPLFISVDEEGGSVSRNPKEVKKLPTARSIGKTKDTALAFNSGRLLGKIVKSFGYNMNFAPVLDIDSNPLNPVIGDRSYGSTPNLVSSMGIEVVKGMKEEGIIPVVKHFPGHGDTAVDSHIGLPITNHNWERLNNFELVPFRDAINNGADVVMVAHILLSKIDSEYPSSMSKPVITDILRNKLGFEGVVITDDMTMGAIEKNYNIGDAAIKSIKAGVDILLIGHNYENALTVLNAIKDAVNKGNILADQIDKSVYRILSLKQKYNLSDTVIEENILNY